MAASTISQPIGTGLASRVRKHLPLRKPQCRLAPVGLLPARTCAADDCRAAGAHVLGLLRCLGLTRSPLRLHQIPPFSASREWRSGFCSLKHCEPCNLLLWHCIFHGRCQQLSPPVSGHPRCAHGLHVLLLLAVRLRHTRLACHRTTVHNLGPSVFAP